MEPQTLTIDLFDLILGGSLKSVFFGILSFFFVMWWLGHLDLKIDKRIKKGHLDGVFVKAWLKMHENPIALAIYLGCRIFAVADLVGRLFGKVIILAIVAGAFLIGGPAKAQTLPSQYDRLIRQASETWLPHLPWTIYWGQVMQESAMKPQARSPVGALGLLQFMPATWREITAAMRLGLVDRTDVEPAIQAGAYYDAKLRRIWSSPRPENDRTGLMMASYNAGAGSLIQAQKACATAGRLPALYADIIVCLPRITGAKNAKETAGYWPSIYRWAARKEMAL